MVGAKKIARRYTPESLCDMDIATSVNKIGEIINISQELNTIMWDALSRGKTIEEILPLYCDIAQLDVMSNIEIDSAKKEYPVNNGLELSEMKKKYLRTDENGKRIMPNFFMPVARKKGYYNPEKKAYISHKTTMDFLQKVIREFSRGRSVSKREFLPFSEILNLGFAYQSKCNYDQIERVINIVQTAKEDIDSVWADAENFDTGQKYLMVNDIRQKCIEYVESISFNYTTMYMLLKLIEDEKYKGVSRTLFSILFGAPNISFFKIIDDSRQPRDVLVESPLGSIPIFSFKFQKQKMMQKIGDIVQF